jgi:hypothetical protein
VAQSVAFTDVFDRYNDVRHNLSDCGLPIAECGT